WAQILMRCAIYTRKSTDEGLEQSFNSLDAQREACAAFIASQKHEGWILHEMSYDDGGWSGGTLERPAVQQLLEDIRSGQIQIIVVYKIDRLTRSLTDFAKLVEIFDTHKVTFVSVTQQFNTTTSMGRLTLNVLLSFAQYEREITGERIRDKFAASKAKGMFMGGNVPVGYKLGDRKLLIDEIYVQVINQIFEAYVQLGSASKVKAYLRGLDIRTPVREHRNGKTSGDKHFTTGHLYQILSNPIYIGKVRHHGKIYDGQHEAILNQNLWDQVQNKLAKNAARPKGTSAQRTLQYPLIGKIFSSTGHRLAPTTVHKSTKADQKNYYRHYTVNRTRREPPYGELTSLPAPEAEHATSLALQKLLADLKAEQSNLSADLFLQKRQEVMQLSIRELTETVVLYKDRLEVTLSRSISEILALTESASSSYPIKPRSVGKRNKIILSEASQNTPNQELILCVAKSWKWYQALSKGKVRSVQELAKDENTTVETITRNLPLAALNPDQIEKLLKGHHAQDLSVVKLLAEPSLI
ncbi:MAG: recombinase family protein, partial [Paracoccaceae bacterium]